MFSTDPYYISHNINDLIAFTAPELHASLAVGFFVDYTQCMVMEGFALKTAFKSILATAAQSNFSRHTNIVHVYPEENVSTLSANKYIFSHPKLRPWGERLPIACNSCGLPHSWSDPIRHSSTIIFNCIRHGCPGVCRFPKPEDITFVGHDVNGGRWMVKSLPVMCLP